MDQNKKTKTIAEKESEVLNFWNDNKIFEKSLFENNKNKDGKVADNNFKFYDGPPFATGLPHPGHLLQSYLKDSIPRYQTMKGNYVRRTWGWDCHGLPIENLIEKELDLKTKKDLVDFGVDKFTKACSDIVLKYDSDWKKTVPVWGRWVDMENQYATVNNTYTESCWWAFSELYKKGYVYEGFKVMHICPRCETPLAASEVALGYQDIKDISVYVKFELVDEPGTYLLAWTTTPWTLPGNTAIAINKNLEYVKVSHNGENLILAKSLAHKVLGLESTSSLSFGEGGERVMKGEDMIGLKYKPVFDYYNNDEFKGNLKNVFGEPNGENIYKVWHADFVTDTAGTGIAHEAPAFGEDDYNLAMQNNIPTILHVGMDGRFTKEVTDFAGERVKWKGETQATDKKVCEFLQNQNKILKTEIITHSYPMCWRCDTPLLNYATNSWFVAVSRMRDRLVEENNKVYWVPDHVREGRMGEWLKGARDWALSRNRYWGAPLPVWKSESETFIPGSLKELQTRTRAKNKYIFVRHAESEPNLTGKINVDKSKNFGLTENGKTQAENIKLNEKVDLIFSSPYLRTLETAEIISKNLGLDKSKIVVEEKLQEFQVGMKNEGRTWQEMYYESHEKINLYHDKIDGADEAKIDVVKRVAKFLSECEEKYEGKTILCVTHNSPMSAVEIFNNGELYERATGNLPRIHKFQNGEVLELDFHPLPVDETGAVNFHIPHIDNLKVYDTNGNLMKREGGVFDCWYESGSMPYAQFHYPFENKELFDQNFPADFISEAQDQTRGWFYTMLILGVGLFDQSPFRSVITSGMINAADGKKISKKLKNYTDPLELIGKYGSDSVRYYLLSSPAVKGESMKFSDEGVKQIYSKNITRLMNVLSFYKLYENLDAGENEVASSQSEHVLDKYIVARFRQVKLEVSKGFDALFVDAAFRPIEKFIDDLSVWFLRRSRDRFKSDDKKTQREAIETTKYILREFAKVLAPIMPFTAEMIWIEMKTKMDPESVHLCAWGNVEELETTDVEAIEKMELVREMVTNILEERNKAAIKVRQPLSAATFKTAKFDSIKTSGEYLGEVMEETNVRSLKFVESDASAQVCELDTNITEELKVEGVYRELVRTIQDARKLAGLNVGENVNIQLPNSLSDFEKQVVESKKEELQKECGLKEISWGEKLDILIF